MSEMRDLQEDQRICDAATEGPWIKYTSNGDDEAQEEATITYPIATFGVINENEDARFISESRQGWPHAIDRAIAAEKERDELRKRAEELHNYLNWASNALIRYTAGEPVPNMDEIISGSINALSRIREAHNEQN